MHPERTRPPHPSGRHAAADPDRAAAVPPPRWWRRLLPGTGDDVAVAGGQVVRVRGPLDDAAAARLPDCVGELRLHQVVVVHLGACDYVNVRGFRALLQLQDQAMLHVCRVVVLDPPPTLRLLCDMVPGRLVLVPEAVPGREAGS